MAPGLLVGVALACLGAGPPSTEVAPVHEVKRGWDAAGIPLVNFTTDRGVGYGLYAAVFHHGAEGAAPNPYRTSVGGQFYETSGGYAYHKLLLDMFDAFGTTMRLDARAGYESWDSAWYFGQGNQTPRLRPDDTPENFYASDVTSLWWITNVRLPVKGPVDLFGGVTVRSADVTIYPGSRLDQERPAGHEGGRYHLAQVGVIVDTRDVEPSTTEGVFSEVSLRAAHSWLGSEWSLWGLNATHRQWWRLDDAGDWVLAVRAGLDGRFGGEAPFFHQHVLGGSQWVELGGNMALRGLPFGRIRGAHSAYGQLELRWSAAQLRWSTRSFRLLAVSFADTARVFSPGERDHLAHLRWSVGGGLRLIYNEVFIVRFDVAVGQEEYTDSADPLGTDIAQRDSVLGIYAMVGHPF